ncbi:hypothetical protein DASC09_037970 [Saccharomycopsis crataegensis]|uniref:Anaphase-promoting complex subunit CDC26 n=1 Tax=Saccharomycopsis crataegensis TaxID=43959 RepID=A0AAV5QPM9_9ASCO|nr:hypothetical protein DASC09_037970 [Saccharomycopsis crataegensis]
MLFRREPTVIRLTPEDVLEYDEGVNHGKLKKAVHIDATSSNNNSMAEEISQSDDDFDSVEASSKKKEKERNLRIGLHSK